MRSGPGKNEQEPKKKSTMVSSKEKWTVVNPIRRQMKKRNPSSGQNGQLVHWWLLIHPGHSAPNLEQLDYLQDLNRLLFSNVVDQAAQKTEYYLAYYMGGGGR